MEGIKESKPIFGGNCPWVESDWTDCDDTIRGGASQSRCLVENNHSSLFGYLDKQRLGGAGFASQRTTKADLGWDHSDYDGLEVVVSEADRKTYTFVLKDELLPVDPKTGREQATISWEYSFAIGAPSESYSPDGLRIRVPWADFEPTYRGKSVEKADRLDVSSIKRMSLMVRSFFGAQSGSFCITFKSIAAYRASDSDPSLVGIRHNCPCPYRDDRPYQCKDDGHYQYRDDPEIEAFAPLVNEKVEDKGEKPSTGWSWLCCG